MSLATVQQCCKCAIKHIPPPLESCRPAQECVLAHGGCTQPLAVHRVVSLHQRQEAGRQLGEGRRGWNEDVFGWGEGRWQASGQTEPGNGVEPEV